MTISGLISISILISLLQAREGEASVSECIQRESLIIELLLLLKIWRRNSYDRTLTGTKNWISFSKTTSVSLEELLKQF